MYDFFGRKIKVSEGMLDKLYSRRDHNGLISLAKEARWANYVNDAMLGMLAAERAYSISPSDEPLQITYDIGGSIFGLFGPEVDRILRKYRISDPLINRFYEGFNNQNKSRPVRGYSRKDDHALLIPGDGDRHYRYVRQFKEFLIDELGFVPRNVFDFSPFNVTIFKRTLSIDIRTHDDFRNLPSKFLRTVNPFDNLVIYYSGHGGEGCFGLSNYPISYENWARPFADHNGNMVFVLDTCYAHSASQPLTTLGILPEKALLLSGAPEDDATVANLFSPLLMHVYGHSNTLHSAQIDVGAPLISMNFRHTFHREGKNLDYLLMKFRS